MTQLQFSSVGFTYQQLADPLIHDLSFVAPSGWTGVVGPNGVGKSTLLSIATGALLPDTGRVVGPDSALICPQRTDANPPELADLLGFPDADAGRLASMLGLEADWPHRWDSLSHGERKRAQIAVALWRVPEMLVVDEPTNHLDRDARAQLTQALEGFNGVGLIVSHDRTLLDRLCRQCLFMDGPGQAAMRPGGVSDGSDQRALERLAQQRTYEEARAARQRIEAEAEKRRKKAMVQDKKRSKRGLRWKDSDAREKMDRVRISGADGKAGRLLSQLDGRRTQASARLAATAKPVRERVGISVSGVRTRRDTLVYREPGTLALPDGRLVQTPELVVQANDRIVLQGPNGSGKTTLLTTILGGSDGRSQLADSELLWIPQEITARNAALLMDRARSLKHDVLGRVISTISRLASDPEKILQTGLPSPGETRKLMLALGLERRPSLIVMDEPTNHLDLVSIQCLEAALSPFEGALLLVSHDDAFVSALARIAWTINGGRLTISDTPIDD